MTGGGLVRHRAPGQSRAVRIFNGTLTGIGELLITAGLVVALFFSELFFETFSELLSASSAVDFFSKATLGLLTVWGWWHETTAIHPVLA